MMKLRDMDIEMIRDLRDMGLESFTEATRELDRRMDRRGKRIEIEMVQLSQLADKEGITPGGLKKRCNRADIPLFDKDGNRSSAGRRAYVNLNLYEQEYR